ncbi:MAG: SLBB domain-containing protein [Bacteroidetes bacterium]|nr:SLBB domain-containing protein [Bacteroidota bacterium]
MNMRYLDVVRKVFFSLFLFIAIFLSNFGYSQNGASQDFSNIHVEDMSDAQIRAFIKQVEASGLGENQLDQIAQAKGMNSTEIEKLKLRVDRIQKQDIKGTKRKESSPRTVVSNKEQNNQNEATNTMSNDNSAIRKKIFGASLFANANLTFEPNLRLATPVDYQLGPDDEILIDIYGFSEASYQLRVSPEGTINVPLVGVVPVSGATIEQASTRIRNRLSTIYPAIKTGATSVNISLGNIRSIRVVITGEAEKPGSYTLPSVATVFNALYASGGPTENGSFRTIQIIRGTSVIAVLDVYDFLLYGSLKNNLRLQDQDVIRVPTYRTRVEIYGQVKREGIFEMMPSETLADLFRFAGDFTERAFRAKVKVLKNTETERKIEDIQSSMFNTYEPALGDQFFVDAILNRFQNRVRINGSIFRPGDYQLTDGLTLSKLISNASGLKEDAFPNRGYITRLKPDLTTEIISFNPAEIVSGNTEDISLRREDVITIPSIFDLKEEYKLTIDGEVRSPGTFEYADNTTLEELIIKAGGLRESASPKRVEISRRVKNSNANSDTSITAQVFWVDIDRDMKQASAFTLKPFDIISVRTSPGYRTQQVIHIDGEVLFPGNYTLVNKNERISDIIKRAGGLTPFAYKEGASLKRVGIKKTQSDADYENYKLQQLQALQKISDDSAKINVYDLSTRNDYVGIDLPSILHKPHRENDLLLENGDVINIPKQLQTVKVTGEILSPSAIRFEGSNGFKRYIRRSGGFSSKALKKRCYIIYANGSVASTRNFLFFHHFPSVLPGAEIFVPTKAERKSKLSTSEIVAVSTGLATIATLIFTVLRK